MRRFVLASIPLCLMLAPLNLAAGPTVVPTAEGQIGENLASIDEVVGPRFESIRGNPGDVLLGGLFLAGGSPPPPPEFQFLTDQIHGTPNPLEVGAETVTVSSTFKTTPSSSRSRNSTDDGDFVAFSFAVDGSMPQTLMVRIATFDESGNSLVTVPIDNIPSFPDPVFADTGVAVDQDGTVTVVYSDLPGMTPTVRAQQMNGSTGTLIGGLIDLGPGLNADVALLDPLGNRLIIPSTDFSTIRGNILDVSGGTPTVLPSFDISTTAGVPNALPQVAADPATGSFTVVWENFVDIQGDPVNIRGRRFDAMGNPIGNDFIVNTTTANAQGQPGIAYGPDGLSAVVWAGDAADTQIDKLDVFLQVYDADGNPIGGETTVNTFTTDVQDRPSVRFLPEPDSQGRPQVAVVWRDVGNADGTQPRGTGTSYRCFSIEGVVDAMPIFADGFESGDTSSWSDQTP